MPLEVVARRADELARKVGPIETLVAMARLEDALACLDEALETSVDGGGSDPVVIDLREVHETMERIQPLIAQAQVRIDSLRAGLDSTS